MMQDQVSSPGGGLIEQLQDIHAVAEPSLWPPAPGWWVLAAIALAVLVFLAIRLIRMLRIRMRRRRLLGELESLAQTYDPQTQPADYLAALNRLFRGVALKAFPDSGCGRLEGEAWTAFIRGRLKVPGDLPELNVLATGPYQPQPVFDPHKLKGYARQWVMNYG